ncbi:urease accessory protein UreF [Aphanothece hegewaldii CCALA 016]|uniref:Urease accessory protein UreF n=1 Tax=Aphanothece hegewaldii CCALA 016 TaxID=2107694 RepID=A0A2T1LUQ7_9CHRO|nr:urease accessory protein UreF [Aphanothece hegewaldii]PSF35298.1 urease accessory protein UreF [Aphanothece hegewaldii CCALA 016]
MKKQLLYLLQITSPTLPVGAYSYSEGIETLVSQEIITNKETLQQWIIQSLKFGSIRIESAIMLRAYHDFLGDNIEGLIKWNLWLSATRETKELRQQSWQMGQSLLKLLTELQPEIKDISSQLYPDCNYAVVFGIAGAIWQIPEHELLLGYLQSWSSNLINAGLRLIPLGQTDGQKILVNLQNDLIQVTQDILELKDEDLRGWGWGLSLASMQHETLYTRLFRS